MRSWESHSQHKTRRTHIWTWKRQTPNPLEKLITLLIVGPPAGGVIPQPSVERLQAMGAWLEVNGEAIYDTKPGPIQGMERCRSTAKPGKVYVHVFDWPEGGEIRLEGLEASNVYLLADADKSPLAVSQDGETMIVAGPAQAPDAIATVVVLER